MSLLTFNFVIVLSLRLYNSHFPAIIYLLKVSKTKYYKKVLNMFKVSNKVWTYFTSFSSFSVVDLEQVNVCSVWGQVDRQTRNHIFIGFLLKGFTQYFEINHWNSDQIGIQDPIKQPGWNFFTKVVNGLHLLTIFIKNFHHRCLNTPMMISSEIFWKELSFWQKLWLKTLLYSNIEYSRKRFPHTIIYDCLSGSVFCDFYCYLHSC